MRLFLLVLGALISANCAFSFLWLTTYLGVAHAQNPPSTPEGEATDFVLFILCLLWTILFVVACIACVAHIPEQFKKDKK